MKRSSISRRKSYRGRKAEKILSGCLLVTFSLIFVASNIFMTTWLPSFDESRRNLSWTHDEYELRGTNHSNDKDSDLLHVVTSRFMQQQPTLRALGKARLKLFETFCLPTMLNQETDAFLWFLMTDPQLDPELLEQLKSLMEVRPNFYLVASNDKLLTPSNVTDILSAEERDSAGADAHHRVLLTGDIDLLRNKMLDPHRPLLIETRLDADDGLRFDSLSQIQIIAKALPVDTRGWQIICSNLHYEWRNNDILLIDANTTESISSGKLRVVRESICVTPGYTLVRHREPPSTDFPSWPKKSHNTVARDWPECKVEDESIVGGAVEANDGNATFDCVKRMGYFPSALRSRTITSAGMSRVETPQRNAKKFENRTKMFWELVQRDFDITPEKARSTSQYMNEHLGSIAYDNLQGQCTNGHSCKNSSKIKLEEILVKTNHVKQYNIS